MHDFCFTIPYGFAVLAGGLLGYLRRGSTASLAGGAGVGGLLLLAGFVSLKAFEKRRNSYLALALETRTLRPLPPILTAHLIYDLYFITKKKKRIAARCRDYLAIFLFLFLWIIPFRRRKNVFCH
jgi:uncharacterized membrane protein (UPF0136 family)